MARTRTLARVAGGAAAAGLIVFACGDLGEAEAAKRRSKRSGGALSINTINVDGASGVAANEIIEVTFNQNVKPRTINEAVFQIREENATGTGFTKQIFGDFQVQGNVVRFYPRLPTHLRNPADPGGGFYAEGAANDNAAENAGLKPSKNYQITVMGRPFVSPVRSLRRNRPLRRTYTSRFQVASSGNSASLYTTKTYSDVPPPQYSFSNPTDQIPAVSDQYTHTGGTGGVPNDLAISLFCTRVPLSPATLRVLGNVELTLLERKGDPSVRRPIDGTVFVEQNFTTTLLVFKPRFPLADQGVYQLRVKKDVKDLTESYDFAPNRARERLREIYDSLVTSRAIEMSQGNPNPTGIDLQDPDDELIPDWPPADAKTARALLKDNVLAMGDTRPEELDPRVMLLFNTRDEPVTDAELRVEFNKTDGHFDAKISTGQWDSPEVPSAASAIMTIAGGSAVDGDFKPTSDVTLSNSSFDDGIMNFRDVVIPSGVTVTVAGTEPVQIRAINFTLDGHINISGSKGATGSSSVSSNPTEAQGGRGGPGGGEGGGAEPTYNTSSTPNPNNVPTGYTGKTGTDDEGNVESLEGGLGGLGGLLSTGTYYSYGGGGGGGGAREAGQKGGSGVGPYASWNGAGGVGGAGSANDDLVPLVGGAGAGAGGGGGMGTQNTYTWRKSASGGAGGGGAINIQVARVLTIGLNGQVVAVGGKGGATVGGSYGVGGPGGGGGGGAVLMRSQLGFAFGNASNAVDVSGGVGGTGSGSYQNVKGGDGGAGYIRIEDPNGGQQIPGSTTGTFDPIGGGVASVVYSKFVDLGVGDPRLVNADDDCFGDDPNTTDALLIEIQATREDPAAFGEADTTAVLDDQNTADETITSTWLPFKVHDKTGTPGGAFDVPGWDPGVQGIEYVFPIDELNSKGYRFVRYRITFQLDDGHRRADPIPLVDFIKLRFQFNF